MKSILALVASAVLLAGSSGFAADERGPGSDATSAASAHDKSAYTLWNPTPPDLIRDMETDRPNKTNTPRTIDAGHFQLETGLVDYVYFRDRSTGNNSRTDTWSAGQFNLRLGVLNSLEINAAITSYISQRFHDNINGETSHHNGFGDTVVGGKLNLWGNDGADGVWATALGIQPQVKLPTARRDLGNRHTEVTAGVPLSMNLPLDFHLGLQTTPGWERKSDNTGYTWGWQNAISVDRVFFGKWDIYVEYWSHVSAERHQQGQGTVDLGVIYQMSRDLTLDTGLNIGINKASPTLEWVLGISFRH